MQLKMVHEGNGVYGFQECSDSAQIIGDNVMPDGHGGCRPIFPVMTKHEAILFLRLDDCPNPERTLRYYREQGLKCVRVGKQLRFTKQALDDFLRENLK